MAPRLVPQGPNKCFIELGCGKIFSVSSDDGTALETAIKLTSWEELFDREDRAAEVTEWIEITEVNFDEEG